MRHLQGFLFGLNVEMLIDSPGGLKDDTEVRSEFTPKGVHEVELGLVGGKIMGSNI